MRCWTSRWQSGAIGAVGGGAATSRPPRPRPVALPGHGRARACEWWPGVMALGLARHGWLPAGDCGWRGHPAEPGMVGGVAGRNTPSDQQRNPALTDWKCACRYLRALDDMTGEAGGLSAGSRPWNGPRVGCPDPRHAWEVAVGLGAFPAGPPERRRPCCRPGSRVGDHPTSRLWHRQGAQTQAVGSPRWWPA